MKNGFVLVQTAGCSEHLSYIWSRHVHIFRHHHAPSITEGTRARFSQMRPRLPVPKTRSSLRACALSETKATAEVQRASGVQRDSSLLTPVRISELSTSVIDVDLLSPMMQHYVSTKKTAWESLGCPPDRTVILMYRVGDFYESFFEDARVLSKVCEIALTSKDAGKALGERVPMAGVPHHCLEEKIRILLENNITVAVVDQVQSATSVPSGKLVERAITRLITPGTACDETLLEASMSSYLAAIVIKPSSEPKAPVDAEEQTREGDMNVCFGFSYADVSTGEFKSTESCGLDSLRRLLITVSPTEVLLVVPMAFEKALVAIEQEVKNVGVRVVSKREPLPLGTAEQVLSGFHGIDNVESVGCRGKPLCTQAAAVLLTFVGKTMAFESEAEKSLRLNDLVTFSTSDVMLLDSACLKNLEVLETARDGIKERSLQWAVDRTMTVMGTRCLRAWLVSPPMCLDTIVQRQMVIECFVKDNGRAATELQQILRRIADLERLGGRLGLGRTTPREFRCLCESIMQIPSAISIGRACFEEHMPEEIRKNSIQSLLTPVDKELLALAWKVVDALVDPAPSSLPSELSVHGGSLTEGFRTSETCIFRAGYSDVLDRLRQQLGRPESWISAIEEKEQGRTSIGSLRIKHIKNVGYVLRIPRSTGEKIMNEDPAFFKRLGYEHVQGTKAELRFRFEDLRMNEREFHSGFSQILLLELRMYEELRRDMARHVRCLRSLGTQIARIDVLAGLSRVALEEHYVKPVLLPKARRVLELTDVRHPVVEQALPTGKTFVPNSFSLGQGSTNARSDMMILCGPNAAGKSCALRSVGLVAILAQIGSFVPARQAKLSVCDRIFTRVGAVDDLARGQSTFQVEMAETACILTHATSSSLVLLDEIGRGTSAVDGIAIAWSVSEFLTRPSAGRPLPPRSMFVTHYHELNHLSDLYDNIQSFHLHVEQIPSVSERESITDNHGWITTYNIVPGPSYESFGIAIARRAGLPRPVIEKAYKVAKLLRAPSQVVGSELRRGLMQGVAIRDDSAFQWNNTTGNVDPDQDDGDVQIYHSGFEDGYRAALAEVHANVEGIITRLDGKQHHH